MERRGARYVRYADDFSMYCSTESEARELGNAIYLFLRDKLHLSINREKSGIRRPESFSILGYGFRAVTNKDGSALEYKLIVSKKRWKSLKEKLKELTRKTTPYTFDERMNKLKEIQRGWVQYFGLAHIRWDLRSIDGWVRSRLRYCIWHHWKKPSRRRKSLIRMGIEPTRAGKWANTRMGGWATARSFILKTTITIARLKRRGYESMLTLYESITPYLNEPLYTRPVRTVV